MEAPEAILSDRVKINGVVKPLTLTASGQLQWSDRTLDVEREVLGFSVEGTRIRIRAAVENRAGICCDGSNDSLERKSFSFEPLSPDLLRVWCERLQQYIDSLGRPKSLFVFVNPYGGKKSASKVFIDVVKPLLEDANIEFTVQETKHQLHAKEIASSLEINNGIVCVSGDGILVEVINGLLERSYWKTSIRTPVGVVPAGPWKKKNLAEYDIVTQCIAPMKVNDQYLTNALLKVNAKLGGLNSMLCVEYMPSLPMVSKMPTLILGMDVSHGSPGQSDIPSIAAGSSRQWPLISKYRASVRTQSPKLEMIDFLFKKVSYTEDDGIIRRRTVKGSIMASFNKSRFRK